MVRLSRGGPAYTEQPFESYKVEVLVFGFAGGIAMAVSVRKITLWRVEVDNAPGALASKLEPLAQLGADLQVVMGYNMGPQRAVIELNPVDRQESRGRCPQRRGQRFADARGARRGRQQAP